MDDGINELRELHQQLSWLNGPLTALSSTSSSDVNVKELEKTILKELRDVEDTIDVCITRNVAARRAGVLTAGPISTLAETVKQIIKDKVPHLYNLARLTRTLDLAPLMMVTKPKKDMPRERNIVGLQDDSSTVIKFLNTESTKLESITIVGMPGLGKTTLAWKIFMDPRIRNEFDVFIWVNISEDLNMKTVLLTILKEFTSNVPDVPINELVKLAKSYLEYEKFLIVMDDVWTTRAWNDIEDFLPMDNDLGRILITSSNKDVAMHANPTREPHNLKFLTEKESWELLQYEVNYDTVTDGSVPQELKNVGISIATFCSGLPLSILVIGGILRDTLSSTSSILSLRKEWNEISKSLHILASEDQANLLEKIISLSYMKLPYELRNCFMYLGVFPADIPVKKLVRLWIAEGLIQETNEMSLEQNAHANVNDLINRNLLMVREAKPRGEAKICYIHDSVRKFCKKEADVQNRNFFQEIHKSDQGVFEPSYETHEKCRRLCIHSYVFDFFKANPALPNVHSFLCFQKYDITLDASHTSLVTDGFALLRVYDAAAIKFPKFPPKILQLVHLKYLTLVIADCKILPARISELWNLQTLILDITSHTLEIDADILMLRQLRHVKTKASISLKNLDGNGEGGKKLQTLSRLSPESCTAKLFSKAKNLTTLGIQGDLSSLFVNYRNFYELLFLNKLKLVHRAEDPMPNLPAQYLFPANLKILVLISSLLDWDELSVLGELSQLEELKLKDNACTGDRWIVDGGFNHLKLLHIEREEELMFWKVYGDAFPELRFLVISNCQKLIDVPIVLGKKLESLLMERVTSFAVSAGDKIEREKKAAKQVFKFDIYKTN